MAPIDVPTSTTRSACIRADATRSLDVEVLEVAERAETTRLAMTSTRARDDVVTARGHGLGDRHDRWVVLGRPEPVHEDDDRARRRLERAPVPHRDADLVAGLQPLLHDRPRLTAVCRVPAPVGS